MSKRKAEEPEAQIVLPVTPFLDMTFQLMFFFLATFNPSSIKEGQMDLSLPAKSEPAAKDLSQVSPTSESHKEEIDDKASVTINLRGQKDPRNRGKISYLTINTDNSTDEEIKATEEDRERILSEKLAKVKPAEGVDDKGKKKVPTVRMAADADVRWAQVMRIMDVCYKTGYQVSFIKPPEGS
jgi:biopolymer transport protein ExbD